MFSFSLSRSLSPLCVCVCAGHLPPSRGVRHGDSDWGDHGEPLLPGERGPAEQVQGAGAGEAVGGGDGPDPAAGRGLAGDQRVGAGRQPGDGSGRASRLGAARIPVSAPLLRERGPCYHGGR